jgi:hypothetical protein
MRASNADGSVWTAPTTVDDFMDAGLSCKLIEFDGNPAAVYANGATQFHLSIASDPAGTFWHREFIYSSENPNRFAAAQLSGGIGVAIDDDDTGALVYKFIEISGATIQVGGGTDIFPPNTGESFYVELGTGDESPYALVLRNGSNKLYYSFAFDGTGQSWSVPTTINVEGTVNSRAGITAHGLPWVCYRDGNTGILKSCHALDPASNQWINAADVSDQPQTVGRIRMSLAGSHPAVAWIDDAAKLLFFAAYY